MNVTSDFIQMDLSTNSTAHQDGTQLPHVNQLQNELEFLSLGSALKLKGGYVANHDHLADGSGSRLKKPLLLESTCDRHNTSLEVPKQERGQCLDCLDGEDKCVQLQTGSIIDKYTHENRYAYLSSKSLDSMDDAINNSAEYVWTQKNVANIAEKQIHKPSKFHQDISTLTVDIDKSRTEANETDADKTIITHPQYENRCNLVPSQPNLQQLTQNDQQKNNYYYNNNSVNDIISDHQKSESKMITPVLHNQVVNSGYMMNERTPQTTYPNPKQLYRDHLIFEDTDYTNSTRSLASARNNTTAKEHYNNDLASAEHTELMNKYIGSTGDPTKYQATTNDTEKGADDEIFIAHSGKHLEALTYGLMLAVIVLALAVMQMYMKIQALEISKDVVRQCGEKQPQLLNKQLSERFTPNEKELIELLPTSRRSLINANKETYKHGDKNAETLRSGLLGRENVKLLNKSTSNRRNMKVFASTRESETTSVRVTSFRNSSTPDVTWYTNLSSSVGANGFESPGLEVNHQPLSRVLRSAGGKRRGKKKWKHNREDFCKELKRDCKSNLDRVVVASYEEVFNTNATQIDSFEGHFFRVINYRQHLMKEECAPHHNWEPEIRACRNNTITFPKRYTILPFYLETNSTEFKKQEKRLAVVDSKGIFHIQKPGEYLIQVSITIQDKNMTHFMAVFLNNEAVLACPPGGFLCPSLIATASVRYRMCNIIGLLEFKKNDTVDIRTMESNITVSLEEGMKSHFRFVLLK